MTRETKITITCLEMVDKVVNTDPLIILSPDEVLQFQDGLTIARFTESLKIFVETINSNIVFCKQNLEQPKTLASQIGPLSSLPGYSKTNQTKNHGRQSTSSHPETSSSSGAVSSPHHPPPIDLYIFPIHQIR